MRLTVDWMGRLAAALEVDPAELISNALITGFSDEAKPSKISGALSDTARMISAKNLFFYDVKSDALKNLGITPGEKVLIDMGADAIAGVTTGDIVLVQVYSATQLAQGHTLLRQYIAPGILTTNRPRANVSFALEEDEFEAHIKGVVVKDDNP